MTVVPAEAGGKHYLCVFRADQNVVDDVVDLGSDPDFRPPLPTWGICRPNVRRCVEIGSCVVFIGYFAHDQRYLVKGWLRVGEKIGYLEALDRFGDRPNVIVRKQTDSSISHVRRTWKRAALREATMRRYRSDAPGFLTKIHTNGLTLVQRPGDDHEVDNWKCQRMFMCRTAQLGHCIDAGACQREEEFPLFRDFIVAAHGEWHDVGRSHIPWAAVAPASLRPRRLRTPRNQHNALRLTEAEVSRIRATLA